MSIFHELEVACPACQKSQTIDAVHSVNADRRPDLRAEILSDEFQRTTCTECQKPFRLDPDLTYLDVEHGLWLAVHPFGHLARWQTLEKEAQAAFELSYGASAALAARELGASLDPRLVFGWPAFREKVYANQQGLDDLALELTKTAVLTSGHPAPITARSELRLVDVLENELVMSWIIAETGAVEDTLGVPKDLYDEIAADEAGWAELRADLGSGYFVDMQRLMFAESN